MCICAACLPHVQDAWPVANMANLFSRAMAGKMTCKQAYDTAM
jgi:hypothetical protein